MSANKEVLLTDGPPVVSNTDLRGNLSSVSLAFTEITGYSEKEAIGQPHSLIRHPDMPKEVFKDMFDTILADKPYSGLLKNRTKSGDYYWVRANITPSYTNGHISGFLSTNEKPSRSDIDQAERIYREMNAGNSGYRMEGGEFVPKAFSLARWLKRRTIAQRLYVICGLLILGGLLVGIQGVAINRQDVASLREVERNKIKPMSELANVIGTVQRNRMLIMDQLLSPTPEVIRENGTEVRANVEKVTAGWKAFRSAEMSAETNALADEFEGIRGNYARNGLLAAQKQLDAGNLAEAQRIYREVIQPLTPKLRAIEQKITGQMVVETGMTIQAIDDAGRKFQWQLAVLLSVVAIVGFALTSVLMRSIRRPIDEAFNFFRSMTEGNTTSAGLDTSRRDELSRLADAARIMQVKFGVDVAETRRVADIMARVNIALDNVSGGVMITDNSRKIVYANASVVRILKDAEADIQQVLPTFRAEHLIGECIDQFHKNPKHQADMLAVLKSTHTAQLRIGRRHLQVVANPVVNAKGEHLGSVAEWIDKTAEVAAQDEINALVTAASAGDFDLRLDLKGMSGFFLDLAKGLNSVVETTSKGLSEVVSVLKALADGDLTRTVNNDYQGLFGELKNDTNTTVARLQEVVAQIKEATDLINTAAKEIAAGNSDLSSRTEEQASSLEETASSMDQLNSTVKQNAENAIQANTLARESNDTAVKSGQMVQQMSTMNGISDSSRKIADIIGVIDSIAFQTNILALNAAVEAARAGEQGRGFAVVATEVRNLAQRSATAAKEIKELIAESTGKVDAGTRLVDQAGVSMTAVVTSFQQVTGLVTDIANASREQATGIEQVTQAVSQMDEVTQQNAALVEEAAAAAESLEEQARSLVQAVSMFKLEARSRMPGPALRDASPSTPRALAATPGASASTSNAGRKLPSPPLGSDNGDEWAEF